MGSSPGSSANNIYSPGSDKLTEVQLYMPSSCQPGSQVFRAFSDVEKHFLFSDLEASERSLTLKNLLFLFSDLAT